MHTIATRTDGLRRPRATHWRRAAWLGIGLCSLLPLSASLATSVEGQVLNRNGSALGGVRVDFFGAGEKKLAFTGANGRFRIELRGGSYRIRVSQQRRRHESRHNIPTSGSTQLRLRVDW